MYRINCLLCSALSLSQVSRSVGFIHTSEELLSNYSGLWGRRPVSTRLEALNNIKQRAKWEDTIICVVLRFVHVIEMNTLRKQKRVYPTTLLMLMTKRLTDITSASESRVLTLSWNGPVLKWSIRICLDISLLKAGHIRYIYITTSKVFPHIWTKCWAEITQQEPETWQLSNLIIKTY